VTTAQAGCLVWKRAGNGAPNPECPHHHGRQRAL